MSKVYRASDESIEHRFDSYIKICIKHRTWNAFRDYRNRFKEFYEIPWDDVVENTFGRYDKHSSEDVTVQAGEFLVDFDIPKLNKMLKELPKRFQTVVILRIGYELSYEEIATILNIRHSTARDYKSRGICLLRKYLKESGNGEESEKEAI